MTTRNVLALLDPFAGTPLGWREMAVIRRLARLRALGVVGVMILGRD